MIHTQVEDAFSSLVESDWLCRVAQATLDAEGHPATDLTVVVGGDEAMRELNRAYRGMDAPTDVLSFGGEAPGFVTAPDAADYLGDVVISYPRAEAQAGENPVAAELALLVVHGVLHLLGHDHAAPDEQEAMWRRQAAVLTRLGLRYRFAEQPVFDSPLPASRASFGASQGAPRREGVAHPADPGNRARSVLSQWRAPCKPITLC